MHLRVHLRGVNLTQYVQRAIRWLVLAALPATIAAILGYQYARHQPNIYQATATLYVQQAVAGSSGLPSGTDVNGSSALAQSYSQMIVDPAIFASVDRAMAGRWPGYVLEGHAFQTTQPPALQTSQLIGVSVQDTIPARAADAANAAANVFIHRVRRLEAARFAADLVGLDRQLARAYQKIQDTTVSIDNYRGAVGGLDALRTALTAYQNTYATLVQAAEQFRVTADSERNSVSVYSPAAVPASAIGPHPTREAILFALVALLICGGAIVLYDYLNDLPRTPEDVEAAAGAPILGSVPRFGLRGEPSGLIIDRDPRSPSAEAFRLIRTNLQFTNVDEPPRTVVVTSSLPGEGKTTTASNLARALADGGRTVTLLDADLRRPTLDRMFPVPEGRRAGLTTLLMGNPLHGHGVYQWPHSDLMVISCGPVPPNPGDLLGSARMRSLLTQLQQSRDGLVILDSPPVLAVADAAILASNADGVVLVVDPSRTSRREIRQAREAVEGVGTKLLGVVLNRLRPNGSLYSQYGRYLYRCSPVSQPETARRPSLQRPGWFRRRREA